MFLSRIAIFGLRDDWHRRQLDLEGSMSWSEGSPPVKVPVKERQRPVGAIARVPGPPQETGQEGRRGWYTRLAIYVFVLAAVAGGVVWLSIAGI